MLTRINGGNCYPVMPEFIFNQETIGRLQVEGLIKPKEESGWILMSEREIFKRSIPYDAVDWDCPSNMSDREDIPMA